MAIDISLRPNVKYAGFKQIWPGFGTWMGDRGGMSISVDSSSNETLNRGPLRCSCGDSMNFPFGLI